MKKKEPEPVNLSALEHGLGFSLAEMRARIARDHASQPELVREYLNDLAKLLSMPEGLRVLWVILERLGLFKEKLFTGNSETYYLLGKHEAAQGLFRDITDADPVGAARLLTLSYRAQKPTQGETDGHPAE
ncbi:MAG: hypothetical protein RDU24_08830 [Humidesulfovibrio sp.]|uniref:hypothetical protein n=1 Tax=Humidesulfovibrio sp. TaxID=2910988 RepID=UPI0027F7D4A2|nr:hypothetical protein [Humidesulfovibrio sp.]MDQ7835472.1 hypothetical protein [Humidesulfovibrio sp.]